MCPCAGTPSTRLCGWLRVFRVLLRKLVSGPVPSDELWPLLDHCLLGAGECVHPGRATAGHECRVRGHHRGAAETGPAAAYRGLHERWLPRAGHGHAGTHRGRRVCSRCIQSRAGPPAARSAQGAVAIPPAAPRGLPPGGPAPTRWTRAVGWGLWLSPDVTAPSRFPR